MSDPDDLAARTRQFAKDLLDEMDKPKTPGAEAAEAQAAEKRQREDRELLEKFYIATGQIKPDQVVGRVLVEMAARIERLPPTEHPVIELPLAFDGHTGVLRFAPSPSKPDKRIVELSIASESGLSTSSQWLDTGSNAELVAYLRRPEVIADTLATALELARSLSRHRLA